MIESNTNPSWDNLNQPNSAPVTTPSTERIMPQAKKSPFPSVPVFRPVVVPKFEAKQPTDDESNQPSVELSKTEETKKEISEVREEKKSR